MKESLSALKPYLRGWPIIVGMMMVFYLGAKKYLSYIAPMYESTVKIRLADNEQSIPSANLFKDFDVFSTKQKIDAEIEVIKSEIIIGKAIQSINLNTTIYRVGNFTKTEVYDDCPFEIEFYALEKELYNQALQVKIEGENIEIITEDNNHYYSSFDDTLFIGNSPLVFTLNKKYLSNRNDADISGAYEITFWTSEKLVEKIKGQLSVSSVDKEVPIVRISVKSAHPQKAADLSNAIAQAYIEDYIDKKSAAADLTVKFLDERIQEISADLAKSEDRILNFRNLKNITNLNQETETELRRIAKLKIQQTNMQMNLEAVKDLERYVDNGKGNFLELATNFEAFSDLLSTEIIKKIKDLQAKKRELLLEYTEENPEVKIIDEKINDLKVYLIESIKNTRKNLEVKIENLTIDLQLAQDQLQNYPMKEQVLNQLKREFEIYQQSYTFLNQKKIEAEIARAAKLSFHRIISPATANKTPISPNKTIIKIVATILGMFISIGIIFIVHMLKARVNSISTIESKSIIPVASEIPKLKTEKEAQRFFLKQLSDWEVKGLVSNKDIISLTGFKVDEGASFIAKQLISVFALQSKKILFIDFGTDVVSQNSLVPQGVNKDDVMYDQIILSELYLNTKDTNTIQQDIKASSKNYDITIILNSIIGKRLTTPILSISDFNLICIDSRKTRAKKIDAINIMSEEYDFKNLKIAFNRSGYNPNVIRELILFAKKYLNNRR